MNNTTTEALVTLRQITSEEAAEFLGVSVRQMERLRRVGNGPKFFRLSQKLVRYRICDLIEFQEKNLRTNNSGLNAA